MRVDFMINDNKSVTMCDGTTSLTTNYLVDYIGWERIYATNAPKQPIEIGIDADNATRPIFIETPDGSAKTMLCTCKVK